MSTDTNQAPISWSAEKDKERDRRYDAWYAAHEDMRARPGDADARLKEERLAELLAEIDDEWVRAHNPTAGGAWTRERLSDAQLLRLLQGEGVFAIDHRLSWGGLFSEIRFVEIKHV